MNQDHRLFGRVLQLVGSGLILLCVALLFNSISDAQTPRSYNRGDTLSKLAAHGEQIDLDEMTREQSFNSFMDVTAVSTGLLGFVVVVIGTLMTSDKKVGARQSVAQISGKCRGCGAAVGQGAKCQHCGTQAP